MADRSLIRVRLFLVLGLAALVGCEKPGPKLYPVRGTVTLDGKPLTEGNVYFRTLETGDVDPFEVKDGAFAGQALAGERRVEVAAYRLIPVAGEMGGEVQESLIAARFNSASTLKATVSPEGPNDFKFEVESK